MQIIPLIRELREKSKRNHRRDAIAIWNEKDRLDGKITDAFVFIMRTTGCRWAKISGCSMCGYYNDTNPAISEEDLISQVDYASSKYTGQKIVKIFTSGSFFDDEEVPKAVRMRVYDAFADADRIIVETRPEFIDENTIQEIQQAGNIMVALGLESANNETLMYRINKGFSVEHYIKASKKLISNKTPIKTYLLLKPPFMTEKQAIEEAAESAKFAAKYSEVISINPMNIQNNTLVEYLWRKGEYRAPWLWSLLEVLKRTVELPAEIVSFPTAAGTHRGAHNCGKCDEKIVKKIVDFSLTQDPQYLNDADEISCECRKIWEKIVATEDYLWDYSVNL